MLSAEAQAMVRSENYGNYFMGEIRKVFSGFSEIRPLAAIPTSEGKVVYFRYSNPGESVHISSVIMKKENNRNLLSLKVKDDGLDNLLQNLYVKEALRNYLQQGM
jgi:hypothetical protein